MWDVDKTGMIANFSPCRTYRYTLWRHWNGGDDVQDYVNFLCLNPSTADEVKDDNTIRKCVKFAKLWGYSSMCVTNLFAYRSTDPEAMRLAEEPIGEDNDYFLENTAINAALVIAAWSQHGSYMNRADIVRKNLTDVPMSYLRMGKGKNPQPWHPLYLPDITVPIIWKLS